MPKVQRIPYSMAMKARQFIIFLASGCILFSCVTGNINKIDTADQQKGTATEKTGSTAARPQSNTNQKGANTIPKTKNGIKQPDNNTDSSTISKPSTTSQLSDEHYSPLAKAVLAELNFVRTDPKRYADEVLVPRRQYFKGKLYTEPAAIPLETQEGITPLNECINALYTTAAIGSLSLETGLCRSAQWLADDQSRTSTLGHTGSDNSAPADRMNRYGTWGITCGENCAYGSHTARDIVVQLLIDDGVPNRGHRINILRAIFTKVGFGFSDKSKAPYGAVAVMDFAGTYTSN